MTARRLLTTALAGAAVVLLVGCERPAPIVTVVSGTQSEWKEAEIFCFEGQAGGSDDCARRDTEPTRLEVEPGARVGVDVGKEVVERGWFVELRSGDQQPQASDVQQDKHYFTFTAPDVGDEGLTLVVRSLGGDGDRSRPTGQWTFELVPAE